MLYILTDITDGLQSALLHHLRGGGVGHITHQSCDQSWTKLLLYLLLHLLTSHLANSLWAAPPLQSYGHTEQPRWDGSSQFPKPRPHSAWCTDEHLLECSTTFPRTETSGPHRWCRGNSWTEHQPAVCRLHCCLHGTIHLIKFCKNLTQLVTVDWRKIFNTS